MELLYEAAVLMMGILWEKLNQYIRETYPLPCWNTVQNSQEMLSTQVSHGLFKCGLFKNVISFCHKNNRILSFATKRRKPEITMINGIDQTWKEWCYVVLPNSESKYINFLEVQITMVVIREELSQMMQNFR